MDAGVRSPREGSRLCRKLLLRRLRAHYRAPTKQRQIEFVVPALAGGFVRDRLQHPASRLKAELPTMKIHEYQAKQLLSKYGVRVPRGEAVDTPAQARDAVSRLGLPVVVKALIHAGGRGKGGGVKLAWTSDQAEQLARLMLGMKLVTHQTGPEGREVKRLLIEEGLRIKQEFYLGIV